MFYPFVSNGKEKDYESGFHYYGARYYWSEVLSGWLSVDPMMDKYPNISPYNYCVWNPVKLVDPDGQDGDVIVNKDDHTVSIFMRIYYDKTQSGINNLEGVRDNPSQIKLAEEHGFSSKSWRYTDENNQEWSVNFDINFIPLSSEEEVSKMMDSDPMGNRLFYDENLAVNGTWQPKTRSFFLGTGSVANLMLGDVGTLSAQGEFSVDATHSY